MVSITQRRQLLLSSNVTFKADEEAQQGSYAICSRGYLVDAKSETALVVINDDQAGRLPDVVSFPLDSSSSWSCEADDDARCSYGGWSSDDSSSSDTPTRAAATTAWAYEKADSRGSVSVDSTAKWVQNQQQLPSRCRVTRLSLKSPAELLRAALLLLSVPSLLYSARSIPCLCRLRLSVEAARVDYEQAQDRLSAYNWGDNFRNRDLKRARVRNEMLHVDLKSVRDDSLAFQLDSGGTTIAGDSDTNLGKNVKSLNSGDDEMWKALLQKALNRDTERRERALRLVEDIQDKSEREVIERFGIGPHYVRIDLSFPPKAAGVSSNITNSHSKSEPSSFVVKLAPLSLMPHSVHIFLDAVSRGVYNGGLAEFNIKAPHLVKASLLRLPHNEGGGEIAEGPAFPEFSPEFPHVPYTLGFVAPSTSRPSDAGFYVNTLNNSYSHSPGGQDHHEEDAALGALLGGGGEPCFGEVVEGREAIDRILGMPLEEKEGEVPWMTEAVLIVGAKIVSSKVRRTWRAPPWARMRH
mmetsp:Transcript_836/g.2398  ORF Transcript_836/g.2398 Transcript_836/m.2398 type:complete len:524 (-) Transcript_836:53-1624(-)